MDNQLPEGVQGLLKYFSKDFAENYKRALESGAFDPRDYTEIEIGRAVLAITATEVGQTDKSKKLIKNLRHFI